MRPRSATLPALCLVAVVASGAASAASKKSTKRVPKTPAPDRVLAIGDIHGSLDGLVTILRSTGVMDAAGNWVGGPAVLVQTGDFTDRGSGVRPVMDLLMSLQQQAPKQGGEVVVLMGNHELWNVMRHHADVQPNPEIYASFAEDRSEESQQQAWQDWLAWTRRRARARGDRVPRFTSADKATWLEAHPPGFVEYQQAMSKDGVYGRWIRGLPLTHQIADTIFLHAGISEEYARRSLDQIEAEHREQIALFEKVRQNLVDNDLVLDSFTWDEMKAAVRAELGRPGTRRARERASEAANGLNRFIEFTGSAASPLWFRGFAPPPSGLADADLARLRNILTRKYGVHHFVSAHSPLAGKEILSRLEGSFFLIDTGMLASVYAGRPSALELRGGRFTAIYENKETVLFPRNKDPVVASEAAEIRSGRGQTRPRIALASSSRTTQEAQEAKEAQEANIGLDPPERVWRDRDGEPIPFANHAEAEQYLREARIVSTEPIGVGKTGALRVSLERNGLEARAVFHDVHQTSEGVKPGSVRMGRGRRVLFFRDSYTSQIAAYVLSRLMGLDIVPPAVERTVNGKKGSLQLWIEQSTTLTEWVEEHRRQPSNDLYQQQLFDTRVWDRLTYNTDRNTGNILWTPDWSLWWIDHTRTFAHDADLSRAELVQRCSRDLLARIRTMDEPAITKALRPYLSIFEIKAIFKRRQKLLRLIEQRIEKLGEDAVLFDYGKPLGTVRVLQEFDPAA